MAGVLSITFNPLRNQEESANTPTQPVPTTAPKTHDVRASFAIFTNGTLRIFSDSRYHNLSPDVYIQSDNPSTIYVKKPGITWDDFFRTLPMKLSANCLTTGTGQTFCSGETQTLKFYVNGQQTPNALEQSINDGDQLLVSFGSEKGADIDNQLKQVPAVR